MPRPLNPPQACAPRQQRGVATLLVAIVILVILTLIVLLSANVSLFEQKTATNENRGRMVEQAAEYAVNMAGEYLKGNRLAVIRKTTGGWLAADVASGKRWVRCSSVSGFPNSIPNLADGSPHPCMSERDATTSTQYPNGGRRGELWFARFDPTDSSKTFGIHQRFRDAASSDAPFSVTIAGNTIGEVLQISNPQDRDAGTVACISAAINRGGQIFRVHHVEAAWQAVRTLDAIG